MSTTDSTASNLTRRTAWRSFSRLRRRIAATPQLNDYYKGLQGVANTALDLHQVEESAEETPAELSDADEVIDTLQSVLPAPSAIFGDQFFTSSIYPIRLLYDIAGLYQARFINIDWLNNLGLSEQDEKDKKLGPIIWLCSILDMSPSETRNLVIEYKKSRTLTGSLRSPSTPSYIAPPTLHLPTTALPEESKTFAVSEKAVPDTSNIDTGRQERVETLHNRNRRESADSTAAYALMKQTQCVTTYFYKKEFSGALTESIAQTLRNYRHAAMLYKLDDASMATNFALALTDPAKDFFLSTVQPGMSFEDISKFMLAEYNSNSRQIQVRRMLDTMRIGTFKSEKGLASDQQALTEMIAFIDSMVPQCPPAFRSADNKISFLRQAIIKEPWATNAVTKVDAGDVSWRQFTTDLHAALSLRREIEPTPSDSTFFARSEMEEAAQVFLTKYGRDPRYASKHYPRPQRLQHSRQRDLPRERDSLSFEEARKLGLCNKCRNDWSPGHRCQGQYIRDHVKNRMRRGDHATHVMAELVQALESQPDEDLPREDDATSTHLIDHEIDEFDAAFGDAPDREEDDSAFATHFLSSALSPTVVDSPIRNSSKKGFEPFFYNPWTSERKKNSSKLFFKPFSGQSSIDPLTHNKEISDRREYAIDTSRAYLIKEAKRSSALGFLVDIGAPKSVIGKKALNRIFTSTKTYRLPRLRHSPHSFRFANETFPSIGSTTLYLQTPAGVGTVPVEIDVVVADIPPLLGLDVIDREGLTPDVAFNVLAKRRRETTADGTPIFIEEWSVPMWRAASRHSYVALSTTHPTHFTRTQLHKLHRQFFHPSAEKLYNLLRRTRPADTTPATRKVLEDITARCDPCQRIRRGPTRFRVTLGAEEVRFNERVLMDIMYIGTLPVLHMVDDETKFSAAAILHKTTAEYIWDTFLRCWAAVYTGLPNRILVDQGTQFGKSQEFVNIVGLHNVEFEGTGIEAHSSLGLGERYHQPLRNTYRKLRRDYPNEKTELLLQFAVKGMNDTLGPEGIVPSLLVFGEYPPAFTTSETPRSRSPAHLRAKMANEARVEMAKHMGKARVARALKHAVPPSTDHPLKSGDQVLVWKEKVVNNRIGEWLGPLTVDNYVAEKKLVYIRHKDNDVRPYGIAQVKRYLAPEMTAFSFLVDINDRLSYFREPKTNHDALTDSYPTEVLLKSDPRSKSPKMSDAIKKEVRGLFERNTFKVILREEVPTDANVLPGRFVLAIKSTEDGEVKYKARFVIGGHRDKQKHLMVHNSATLQPQSIRLLLALAHASDFDIWTADVTQAYLQSTDPLLRDIFITKPIPEFELAPHECVKLMKPLYGLCDAGDLWAASMDKHHRVDLGLTPMRSDPAFYISTKDGKINGFSGSYVDDMLRAGDATFRSHCRTTHETFDMGNEEPLPGPFTGFYIAKAEDGALLQHQKSYLKNLETLPMDADFPAFRSMRMKLAWLVHTRADCLFEISQLAQVTVERFNKDRKSSITRLNKATRFAVDNPLAIRIPKLDMETIKVVGFADASFANNYDLSTQLGHIVFLCDSAGNAAPIAFKSYKSRRVVRSAMAGEVIAFSDMFDVAVTLAEELRTIYNRTIPLHLLTDSKALFDIISKGSRTSEKRMMLDIAAAREGFRDRIISDIGFVRSSDNLADGLTKPMQQAALQRVLQSGKLAPRAEQWIIRN